MAGLQVEQFLLSRTAAAEGVDDLPQLLFRQRPLLQRLDTALKLLYRRLRHIRLLNSTPVMGMHAALPMTGL
jgi:hypothetical protein